MEKTNYWLKYHQFYADRITSLITIVERLYKTLPHQEYVQHQTVKLLARLYDATSKIIPNNPNHADYYLRGNLAKYRRYKKGLFRLIFCFSTNPPIIVYLYINDNKHLRQAGSLSDPYHEFETLVKKDIFSHDPQDTDMQK
jgi:mRNA-degrading endonuclease RelE of RelBE toxin-antitoxin system